MKKTKLTLPDSLPYYLTETNLSERLNIPVRTLQSQRLRGDGIPYVKIGRSVRYSLADVEEYLQKNRSYSTREVE
jgi:excisionase family DNA binding protein